MSGLPKGSVGVAKDAKCTKYPKKPNIIRAFRHKNYFAIWFSFCYTTTMGTMVSMVEIVRNWRWAIMKIFHPIQSILVDASPPHPDGTQYKISIGNEFFGDVPQTVLIVQMVYKGRVEGRKSPSFPTGTDDFSRVSQAADSLLSSFSEGGAVHE